MKRCLFLCFLLMLLFQAQAQRYNFKTWSSEHGLPQSQVMDIIQDRSGHLWLATLGGVSRFDGVKFENFTQEQGLSSSNTKKVFQDSRGYIWIATFDEGICRYNGDTIRHFGEKEGLPPGGVLSIAEDKNRTMWFATSNGIYKWNGGNFTKFVVNNGFPDQKYWDILFDSKGNLWATTLSSGVFCYNGNTTTNYTIFNSGLSNNIVYAVYEDSKGNIWLGTYGGVTRFNGKTMIPYTFAGENTINRGWDFCEDSFGKLWVALDGGGILQFNNREFKRLTTENGLASNFVSSVFPDREGNIWVGTSSGLQRFSTPEFTHYTQLPGNAELTDVRAVAQDKKGNIWVGAFDRGAGYYDGEKFTWFTTQNGLGHNLVNDIKTDKKGNVWLCTNYGITRYNQHGFKTFTEDDGLIYNIVNHCTIDKNGNLWLGTNEGLSFFDGKCFKNYVSGVTNRSNLITTTYLDSKNNLWIGTKSGVYTLKDDVIVPAQPFQHLNLKWISAITEDAHQTLWLTAYDRGLVGYNPTAPSKAEQIKIFSTKNGLLTNSVNSLLIDKQNRLWIGSIKGLCRFSLDHYYATDTPNIQQFTRQNGFSGIECNANAAFECRNGNIWFGTIKNLTRYNPKLEKHTDELPLLKFNGLRLDLREIDWESLGFRKSKTTGLPVNLELPFDQNHLTFDYLGLYFSNPEKVKYQYKLIGFEEEWNAPTSETKATYSNISPGTYTFVVKATNGNNIWTEKPLSYTFSITPPFWRTDWFIFISLMGLAFISYKVLKVREESLVRINTMLEQKVQHRTLQLQEKNQEKEILLKEVHHRVKNNLQIITSMLNLQARHVSDPAASQVLREVKDRVKSMSMLHQRLYQQDDLAYINLADYTDSICTSLFRSYGVGPDKVQLKLCVPPLQLDLDTAINLGLIINELVSNTLKHAFPDNRTGVLIVEAAAVGPDSYQLTIADNGTGIPQNKDLTESKSFGLKLVTAIISKLNGTLKINSDKGTIINIFFTILPKSNHTT
ncbi:MAG: hypothetical protein LPJ89_10320 [Hymenobacteraceae bacterium]|nr:hypothetical protein [Hymenobacteraceae bacterium]MDX5396049.1 hypothetical protein [Hymenobacteraceae bacterium]MDX5444163.1 hypothetical protein [Hymenobacteraceae bacterium]MDX5512110.1 hypothetical protein [Hymenobacteraceae bacterium]